MSPILSPVMCEAPRRIPKELQCALLEQEQLVLFNFNWGDLTGLNPQIKEEQI